jgi:hypothetical protein
MVFSRVLILGIAGIVAVTFFRCAIDGDLSLHDYQVLSSLACRYSLGLTGMAPFVQPLYAMVRGWSGPRARRRPSSWAKLAIVMWRAVVILLLADPSFLAVPLQSFKRDETEWDYYIISDAGPLALGVAIYARSSDTCLAHASYVLPYEARDPKFQNAREFHGLLLGEIILCMLHIRHARILWRGDNTSALTWARKNTCSSTATQRAFLAHSWLSLMSGNVLVQAIHQAGVTMGDIDGLSRLRATQFSESSDVSSQLMVDELFIACDPTIASPHLDDHFICLCTIIRFLSSHTRL